MEFIKRHIRGIRAVAVTVALCALLLLMTFIAGMGTAQGKSLCMPETKYERPLKHVVNERGPRIVMRDAVEG